MTVDYSKSKFENATAEEAFATVLDGSATESIYEGEQVRFEKVWLDSGLVVILRYDDPGFVWVEYAGEIRGDWNVERHWEMLLEEYSEVAFGDFED